MGTDVTVLAAPDAFETALDATRSLFAAWDGSLSRFTPRSELSRVNQAAGRTVPASQLLLDVVGAALEAADATDGLFDPTLLTRLRALGYDRDFAALPVRREATELEAFHGGAWRRIELDRRAGTIRLPAGAELDLGGIAKGMAVDAAVASLRELGLAIGAVNAGGDLAVFGDATGSGWPVSIDGIDRTVWLTHGALATSSVERRRWRIGDEERHHLLDPRTGFPTDSGVLSATVAATTCRAAEVAAKTAVILGPTFGAQFLAEQRLTGLLMVPGGDAWRIGEWKAAA